MQCPLVPLTRGDVGIERDEAAIGQPVAPRLYDVSVRTQAFHGADLAAREQHVHAPRHLGFHVYRTELASLRLGAQDVLHLQANPQNVTRHAA